MSVSVVARSCIRNVSGLLATRYNHLMVCTVLLIWEDFIFGFGFWTRRPDIAPAINSYFAKYNCQTFNQTSASLGTSLRLGYFSSMFYIKVPSSGRGGISCSHYFEAEADSEAITVSLRQLYSPVRLYTNSLHPILQHGSQWPLLPSSKGLTFLPLFPRGRSDLKGWQGKGMTFSSFGPDGACPSRLFVFLGFFFFSFASEILKALMLCQPQVILRVRFVSPSLSLFNIFSLWVCG